MKQKVLIFLLHTLAVIQACNHYHYMTTFPEETTFTYEETSMYSDTTSDFWLSTTDFITDETMTSDFESTTFIPATNTVDNEDNVTNTIVFKADFDHDELAISQRKVENFETILDEKGHDQALVSISGLNSTLSLNFQLDIVNIS